MGEFIIGNGTEPMLLLVERPGMGEVLDLAKTLYAKAPPLVQLTLQLPVHLKLQAVYLDMIADLADEEGVDRSGVVASNELRQWPEENFVRRIIRQRKFIERTKCDA